MVKSENYSKAITLDRCGDAFHIECVRDHIISCLDSQNFPITCPNYECRKEIAAKDLKVILDEKIYDRLSRFEWKWIRDKNSDM